MISTGASSPTVETYTAEPSARAGAALTSRDWGGGRGQPGLPGAQPSSAAAGKTRMKSAARIAAAMRTRMI